MKEIFTIKNFKLESIRSRYILGVLLISVLFVISVWSTSVFVADAINNTASSGANRNKLIEYHRIVREHLWKAESAMQTYLVTPENIEYDQVIFNINKAIESVKNIKQEGWLGSIGI